MTIQIRLSDRVDHTQEQIASDSLNRSWCGYDPTVSDEVLWEHNRGRWNLNEAKIAEEIYATFVYGGEVVAAYALRGHERVTDPGPIAVKIALIGEPLDPRDPAYRQLVGKPATGKGRNPVNYVDDPTVEESTQRAFLLTWNPDRWDWVDFGQSVLATHERRSVDSSWSTGTRKGGISTGDRVFLLRQGQNDRGIIGCGQAADFSDRASRYEEVVYPGPHWDGSGSTANYVDVLWNRLLDTDDLLPLEQLQAQFPSQDWTPQSSGTKIRPELLEQLEVAWSNHVGSSQASGEGQGRVVDAARRKAIEDAAQDWLMQHYRDEKWIVTDTRYSGPYDAIAKKDGATLYLEAKGTQSSGDAVFLTHGEVEHARRHLGECMIGIWSGIRFTDEGEVDQDAGETLLMPFEPDTGTLTPLQYRWEVGADD